MKTSVPETEEVVIEHLGRPLGQDIVYILQKAVGRGIPPFGRCLDESLRDNVQGVTWKFPCPCPRKFVPVGDQLCSELGAPYSSPKVIT